MRLALIFVFLLFITKAYGNTYNPKHSPVSSLINTSVIGIEAVKTDNAGNYIANFSEIYTSHGSKFSPKSGLPTKNIKWNYGGVTWKGWSFSSRITKDKGEELNIQVTDIDGNTDNTKIKFKFAEACLNAISNINYGRCLVSPNYSQDGDYIPVNKENISFKLSDNEAIKDNLKDYNAYLENNIESGKSNKQIYIPLNKYITLSKQYLNLNLASLIHENEIDLEQEYTLVINGSYKLEKENINPYFPNRTATQYFKFGTSYLNIEFNEPITQISIYSLETNYGKIVNKSLKNFKLQYLPSGEYTIHAESKDKEGRAKVYINPQEEVKIVFEMQPKDLSYKNRKPLSHGFKITKKWVNNLKIKPKKLSRESKVARLKTKIKKAKAEILKLISNDKNIKLNWKDIIYVNGMDVKGKNTTKYTQDLFNRNYKEVKRKLEFYSKKGNQVLFTKMIVNKKNKADLKLETQSNTNSQNKAQESMSINPLSIVYNMKVSGVVPHKYFSLPNKNIETGPKGNGAPVKSGEYYQFFIFGDLPFLHFSKSIDSLDSLFNIYEKNRESYSTQFENIINLREEMYSFWSVLEDLYEDLSFDVRFTIVGTYQNKPVNISYDYTYFFKDFKNKFADIRYASSEYASGSNGEKLLNNGWLFTTYSKEIPSNFENPKIYVELLSGIPSHLTEIDDLNLKSYISSGVISH